MKNLRKVLFLSLLWCFCVSLFSGTVEAKEHGMKKGPKANIDCDAMQKRRSDLFEKRDMNKDGFLSEGEWKNSKRKVKEMDEIEQKEVKLNDEDRGYWNRQGDRRDDRKSRKFKKLDKDGDGFVNKDEFMQRGAYGRHCMGGMSEAEMDME